MVASNTTIKDTTQSSETCSFALPCVYIYRNSSAFSTKNLKLEAVLFKMGLTTDQILETTRNPGRVDSMGMEEIYQFMKVKGIRVSCDGDATTIEQHLRACLKKHMESQQNKTNIQIMIEDGKSRISIWKSEKEAAKNEKEKWLKEEEAANRAIEEEEQNIELLDKSEKRDRG